MHISILIYQNRPSQNLPRQPKSINHILNRSRFKADIQAHNLDHNSAYSAMVCLLSESYAQR